MNVSGSHVNVLENDVHAFGGRVNDIGNHVDPAGKTNR